MAIEYHSDFVIAIKRMDGYEVTLRPNGIAARLLIKDTIDRAIAKGVGIFKTEKVVGF